MNASIHLPDPANNSNDLRILEAVTQIVCATIAKSPISSGDVPALFTDTFNVVRAAVTGEQPAAVQAKQEPAVNPKKSIHDDYIVCLEDGKKFKSLKRHIMTHYGLTPDQYRAKWDLKSDYPMVSPNYATARSNLAKKMGLGKHTHERRPAAKQRKAA